MLTVTTDPDLDRNELCRTPLRVSYMGMKCLGRPRTAIEADFLVSEPKSETRRWATRFPGNTALPIFYAMVANVALTPKLRGTRPSTVPKHSH